MSIPYVPLGPDWRPDETARYMAAVDARHSILPPGRLLRPGGSWEAKAGVLVTLVAVDPEEEPDSAGRRPSDLLVGTVLAELATPICDAYRTRLSSANSFRRARQDCAADLRRLAQQVGNPTQLTALADTWDPRR